MQTFFSTPFVHIGSGSFQMVNCTWVYFAVTIPLTVLTIAAWALLPNLYIWTCNRISARRQENPQEACDVESDEGPKEVQRRNDNRGSILRILGKICGGLSPQVDSGPETLAKQV